MITLLLAIVLPFQAEGNRGRVQDGVRVIRSESGSKGAPTGDTFVFAEQRDSFDLASDKEVIVAFEWDGPPGTHRCELSWIAPDGSVGLQTRLDLPAKGRRFSGFWSLILNPTMPRGLWAAEVKVDGIAAGSKTFRIAGPPILRPLPPDELYELASEGTLRIEARLPAGAEPRVFSGFALSDDSVITTFGAINAASSLQISFSDGTQRETDEVWLFSRDLDWALLKAPIPSNHRRLKIADSTKIGEPCAFLNIGEGQKELAPCSVVGQNNSGAVQRWSISNRPTQASFGAPVLNSVGAVIGLVGVDAQPGGGGFDEAGSATALRVGSRSTPSGLLVLPVRGIQPPESSVDITKLAAFWTRGLFYKLVTAGRHVSYGFLAAGAADPQGKGITGGGGSEFYNRDAVVTALLQWQPREKIDTTLNHACFDSANRLIIQGKPIKASLRPGVRTDSSSQIDISRFKPGEYRIDVSLGDEVAWRTFFKIKG